jgi:hypothetical protein
MDTYAAHTLLSLNRPLRPIAIPELLPQLQPPPFTNPALTREPRWVGSQGPLVYRSLILTSPDGTNPYNLSWKTPKTGVRKIRVNSVRFPVSFYKIRTDETLVYTPSGGSPISIPIYAGNYSFPEMRAYFARKSEKGFLQLYNTPGEQSLLTLLTENSQPMDFSVDFSDAPDLKAALGYANQADTLSSNGFRWIVREAAGVAVTAGAIRSTNNYNFAAPNEIFVSAPSAKSLMRSRTIDLGTTVYHPNAMVAVPIDVCTGQFVHWINTIPDWFECYGSGEYMIDEIGLTMLDGSFLDFKGLPWSMELGLMTDDEGSQSKDITS